MPRPSEEDLFKNTTMTFGEHLEELRACLFKSVLGLAVMFLVGLWWADETVDFIQTPLEKALGTYLREQTVKQLAELQEQGRLPPGDPERFEDLVLKDDLLAKEAYVDPVELLDEWKKAGAEIPIDVPEALGSAAEKQQTPQTDGGGSKDAAGAGESADEDAQGEDP